MSITQQVIYELGLKDKFSGGILSADGAVKKLEHSLGSVIAKGVALFAGFEFLKGSVEMFNEAAQASAQLNATMTSTGNIAGLNREALDKQAESLMSHSLFDDDEVTKAQSILATFTNIRGEVYMNTIPAIADLATKMGTDLQGATLQVAKAMNDLSGHGLAMLKKSGVDFSKQQIETIKNLFATNRAAEAQTMILRELNREFAGSAQAASEAGTGPFTVLRHEFNNVREEIGELLVKLGVELMPVLKKFVEIIKTAVDWVREHAKMLKALAIAVGSAWLAFKVIAGVIAIARGIAIAFIEMGAAATPAIAGVEGIGAAMTAALGPIGLVAAALGSLIFLYKAISDYQDQEKQQAQGAQNAMVEGDINKQAEYWKKKGFKDDEAFKLAKERTSFKYLGQLKDIQAQLDKTDIFTNPATLAMLGAKKSELEMKVSAADHAGAYTKIKEVKPGKDQYDVKPEKMPKTQAAGSKNITINVSIKELIGIKDLNTTTIKEGMTRVHDAIVDVMSSAVNDFQVIASNT